VNKYPGESKVKAKVRAQLWHWVYSAGLFARSRVGQSGWLPLGFLAAAEGRDLLHLRDTMGQAISQLIAVDKDPAAILSCCASTGLPQSNAINAELIDVKREFSFFYADLCSTVSPATLDALHWCMAHTEAFAITVVCGRDNLKGGWRSRFDWLSERAVNFYAQQAWYYTSHNSPMLTVIFSREKRGDFPFSRIDAAGETETAEPQTLTEEQLKDWEMSVRKKAPDLQKLAVSAAVVEPLNYQEIEKAWKETLAARKTKNPKDLSVVELLQLAINAATAASEWQTVQDITTVLMRRPK
jgi:hypothetical protein